jgi:hypothetical protein
MSRIYGPEQIRDKETVDRKNALAKQIHGEGSADEDVADVEKPLYATVPRPSLPKELEARWPAKTETVLRQYAHSVGLTDVQFKPLLGLLEQLVTSSHGKGQMARKAGEQALRTEWGPNYDQNLGLAEEVLGQYPPHVAAVLRRTGLQHSVELIKIFYELGEARKNQGLIVPDVDGIQGEQNIRAQMKRLMNSDPYFDSGHKNHRAVVEAHNKLARRIPGAGEHDDD